MRLDGMSERWEAWGQTRLQEHVLDRLRQGLCVYDGERRLLLPFGAAPEVLDDAVQRLVRARASVEEGLDHGSTLAPLELSA